VYKNPFKNFVAVSEKETSRKADKQIEDERGGRGGHAARRN